MRLLGIFIFFVSLILPGVSSSLETDEWIEDLRQYENGIRTLHIDPFSVISEDEFNAALRALEAALSELSDAEVILELMRLTRLIGDGHTAIRVGDQHRFPLELCQIGGDWRVVGVQEEYAELLGSKVTGIDGHSISEVAVSVAPFVQHVDNANSEAIRLGETIVVAEILETLGLIAQDGVATFGFSRNGIESQAALRAIPSDAYFVSKDFVRMEPSEPAIESLSKSGTDFLWYGRPAGTNAVYVRFGGYPSFEAMESFGEELLAYIDDNEISQLAIDLRGNDGGDFFVGLTLAYYLNLADSVDWKNAVYVLTDKYTFSAAVSNAAHFRQILNAKIVGEPTGGNPVGYQDMGRFQLQNSGLTVTYSKRLFRFQDTATEGILPDIPIQYDWASYVGGVDNILKWVVDSF